MKSGGEKEKEGKELMGIPGDMDARLQPGFLRICPSSILALGKKKKKKKKKEGRKGGGRQRGTRASAGNCRLIRSFAFLSFLSLAKREKKKIYAGEGTSDFSQDFAFTERKRRGGGEGRKEKEGVRG